MGKIDAEHLGGFRFAQVNADGLRGEILRRVLNWDVRTRGLLDVLLEFARRMPYGIRGLFLKEDDALRHAVLDKVEAALFRRDAGRMWADSQAELLSEKHAQRTCVRVPFFRQRIAESKSTEFASPPDVGIDEARNIQRGRLAGTWLDVQAIHGHGADAFDFAVHQVRSGQRLGQCVVQVADGDGLFRETIARGELRYAKVKRCGLNGLLG